MAMWKHYIVLFGGFYDPGHRSMSLAWDATISRCTNMLNQAQYLYDTWIFDTQEYKWRQIEFKDTDRKPSCVALCLLLRLAPSPLHSARSGFSFLSTPEGIVLH